MRHWLRAMAIGVTATMAALPAQAETLTDALIDAYRNSNLLEQNQAVLRAADEDVATAVSALRPVVRFVVGATQSWNDTRSALTGVKVNSNSLSSSMSLNAELTLIDFGRNRLGIEIARESVLETRQALVSVEQSVLLAAVQAYVDVRLTQEIVALRQNNVRLIDQELGAARDRFDVGEITRTDVSIAEAALAAARSALAAAQGNYQVARESYKAAVGHYPGNLAALPAGPAIPRSLDEARGVAVRTHPAVRQAQHAVTAADLRVNLAKANTRPTIGLSASAGLSGPDNADNESASLGLSMSQTVYAGGALSSAFRKAVANQEANRAGLRQTVVEVEQSVGNIWATLAVYVASIEASRQQIVAAQAAFDGVREEAALGARTTLDVLDAEQDLLDARAARLEAEASRYVAVYQVLSAMGLLTVEHLNLGIPTYDPESYYKAVKGAPSTSVQGKKLDRILEKAGQ